jgi:cholesterol oxidase
VTAFDCDVAVVGSGFGGAVSALRLAEKGYDVAVLEAGRRLTPADLMAARRRLRDYLWQPEIGLHGFFWQRLFRDVGIIGGTGVGGGSIVWGAVLLEPADAFFADPAWADLADWRAELAGHYATAARMLGRTTNPHLDVQDDHLRRAAAAVGAEATFGPVPLGIHFGSGPGVAEPDPFFDGAGPARAGCLLCGGCLVGCPYGAKNTLDLNYLHLAERLGARILPRHRVDALAPLAGGGYLVHACDPLRRNRRQAPLRARRVVLAAGVLGTLELLFRCRDELGTLPHVSRRLGVSVRTNSEAVTGILARDGGVDLLRGPSISSDFHPDARTHVTQNRFRGGGRLLRAQVGPLVDDERRGRRARRTLRAIAAEPRAHLRVVLARRFDQRYTALTVMQHADNALRLRFGRSPVRPWRRVLRSAGVEEPRAPSYLPVANAVTRAYARSIGGTPLNLLPESVGGVSVTAHILGGAVIGADGVADLRHEVRGHPGLYVADASAIPANVGVNPSLTVTAMAERFAAAWPARSERADAPAPPAGEWPLPASLGGLRRLWRTLPAPSLEAALGDLDARFTGPRWLQALAPRGLAALGLPGWRGKRFEARDAELAGTNRTAAGERLAMRARPAASAIDGRPALVVTYAAAAPLPWRRVRDELRELPDGRLLALSMLDVPLPALPLPFLLVPRRRTAER